MVKKSARILFFIFATSILSSACGLGHSVATSGTRVLQETVVPSTTEGSPIPVSETPTTTATPKVVPPPVLERPGLKIVYTREGNLFLWTEDGKIQLTSSGDAYSPNISPDGQVVAFLRPVDDFHLELWAINTDGTNERWLVSIADLDAIGGGVRDPNAIAINPFHYEWVPSLSNPDKKSAHVLAFNTQQVFRGPGLSLLDDLHLVNADDIKIEYLLLSGWGGEFEYSPDGTHIAISNPTSINLCQADGSNCRTVFTYEPVNTYSEYRFYAAPVWSSDGAFLWVTIPPKDPLAEPRQLTGLWTIPTDGSPVSQLGSVITVPFFEQPVVSSPDLSHIIFFSEVGMPAENRREMHLAAYDGSGDRVYAKFSLLHFLGWSADSNKFSFNTGEDQEAWIGSLDNPPALFPLEPYGIVDLRWVDARNFLFLKQRTEGFEFFLSDVDGGAIVLDAFPSSPPVYDFAYP
jgi:hypothetical protein